MFASISIVLLFNTFYLQTSLGWTAAQAGAACLIIAIGATLCAPISGYLVGRCGPRVPLMLAGSGIAASGFVTWLNFALLGMDRHPSVPLLLLAYAIFGVGVGFANAPITTSAVSSLTLDRAGVAGGMTSTARQLGSAVGIAFAGALLVDFDGPSRLTPGWALVTLIGLSLIGLSTGTRAKARS